MHLRLRRLLKIYFANAIFVIDRILLISITGIDIKADAKTEAFLFERKSGILAGSLAALVLANSRYSPGRFYEHLSVFTARTFPIYDFHSALMLYLLTKIYV